MTMKPRRTATPPPLEIPRRQRMRQRLAEFARLREARLARPVEETLADVKGWLPESYWPAVEQALRSGDSKQAELPTDFLQTFKQVEREAGLEAARCYEHETLARVRGGV